MLPDPIASEGTHDEQAVLERRLAAAERANRDLRQALAEATDREQAIAHELQHRVRNMLSVTRSVYRRTRDTSASQEEFAEHFQGRLDAIARYQAHLDHHPRAGIDLEDMLREELLAAHCQDGAHCRIEGPTILLQQKAAELMGLAFHELTTNSIKFGAIANDALLEVHWSVEQVPDGARLRLRWTETGVSPVSAAPRRSGSGRQLIEDALPYALDATTSFQLKPGGLECIIVLPVSTAVARSDAPHSDPATGSPVLAAEPEKVR